MTGQFDGTSNFVILDSFPSENDRNAHLNGKFAASLVGNVGKLIDNLAINKTDILIAGGHQGKSIKCAEKKTGLKGAKKN